MAGRMLKKALRTGVVVVLNYQSGLADGNQSHDLFYSAAVALAGSSGAASMKPPDCRFHSAA